MSSNSKGDAGRSGAQYHCDYCRKDISSTVRIRCAECADFDLCLECFSVGVEVYPHKNNHKYRVIDHVTTPIFEEDWGADEELLLLEGIEMYGLGNWSDVADHVGTKKAARCEQHYYDIYLNTENSPLPNVNAPLKKRTKSNLKSSRSRSDAASQSHNKSKTKKGKSGLASLVGYLPQRGDFDQEYENDAELIIADMEFKPEDTQQERELKLKVLEIYNSKLDDRVERKKFILERGLLDTPKHQWRTRAEARIEESLRPFARFHSKEEHEKFVQGIVFEYRLRKRIEKLQEYRTQGIRTFADAVKYERLRGHSLDVKAFNLGSVASMGYTDDSGKGKRKGSTGRAERAAKRGKSEKSTKSKAKGPPSPAASSSSATGPLNVRGMDGAELLSPKEVELCSQLRLIPRQYFSIKDAILQHSWSRGFLQSAKAKQLITVDIHRSEKVFDFMVSAGWVREPPVVQSPPGSSPSQARSAAMYRARTGTPTSRPTASPVPASPASARQYSTVQRTASSGSMASAAYRTQSYASATSQS